MNLNEPFPDGPGNSSGCSMAILRLTLFMALLLYSTCAHPQSLYNSITREQWDMLYSAWGYTNHHIATKGFKLSNTKAAIICLSISVFKESMDELAHRGHISNFSIYDDQKGWDGRDIALRYLSGVLVSIVQNKVMGYKRAKPSPIIIRQLPLKHIRTRYVPGYVPDEFKIRSI